MAFNPSQSSTNGIDMEISATKNPLECDEPELAFMWVNQGSTYPFPIILIHGWISDRNIWRAPQFSPKYHLVYRNKTDPDLIDLGTTFHPPAARFPVPPMTLSPPLNATGLYDLLKDRGFDVCIFDQRYPGRDIEYAIDDLESIITRASQIYGSGRKFLIIGHSRGGLVARGYIARKYWTGTEWSTELPEIQAVITLGTPHNGSQLAKIVTLLFDQSKELSAVKLGPRLRERFNIGAPPTESVETLRNDFQSILGLFERLYKEKHSIAQLDGHNPFIVNLNTIPPHPNIGYYCAAGSNPTIASIYLWRYTANSFTVDRKIVNAKAAIDRVRPGLLIPRARDEPKQLREVYHHQTNAEKLFSIPDDFQFELQLAEVTHGQGDFAVAVSSALAFHHPSPQSQLPPQIFTENHIGLVYDPSVQKWVLNILRALV